METEHNNMSVQIFTTFKLSSFSSFDQQDVQSHDDARHRHNKVESRTYDGSWKTIHEWNVYLFNLRKFIFCRYYEYELW